MTRQNALCAALALPVAAFVWYPALLPAAAGLGGLAAVLAVAAIPGRRRGGPAPVVTRMPTRYEREARGRWLPGVGIGISPRGGWHLLPFISIWRIRR
jgi:hypothetical protein